MTAPIDPNRSLEELLRDLELAVSQQDRVLAMSLEQAILQRLFMAGVQRDEVERQTRALMQTLAQAPAPAPAPAPVLVKPPGPGGFSFDTELSTKTLVLSKGNGVVYPVWFATNRKADVGGFSGQRGETVTHGRVDVFVPDAHRFGETGTSLIKRLARWEFRDDHLRVQQITLQERNTFFAAMRETMQRTRDDGGAPEALIFIHGFNVSFEEAAIRSAQIGVDLGVLPGASGFFSWPSKGDVKGYPADEASIEASERAIADFLIDFTASCGAQKVHLIAHSMGNRGLLRALQRIAADAQTHGKVKFGQIFLAAPDLDRDLFLDLAHLYPMHSERTTLYASDADLPVHLSSKLHAAPRAGYFQPYTVAPKIDTVCVPDFDLDLLGHGYFAQAEALLYDIGELLRTNASPPRQRIVAVNEGGQDFWRLKR
ncbi:MAG: alpha/beta hydrolase [Cytophagales bacterium]|nr:alpha/beta hydrolase [Rhizobacter sp.]